MLGLWHNPYTPHSERLQHVSVEEVFQDSICGSV